MSAIRPTSPTASPAAEAIGLILVPGFALMSYAGVVTLPREERERTTPYGFSSGGDDLAPRAHRRGAKCPMRLG
jgi:hypothetical protein